MGSMSGKSPEIGSLAPDFELEGTVAEPVRLTERLSEGPVILYFYSSDFGAMCTVVMKRFKRLLSEIEELGYQLLAISMDSVRVHRAWKERMKISFPLLSDPGGAISERYGALMEEGNFYEGITNRALFIVDEARNIRYAWVAEHAAMEPEYEEFMEAIRSMSTAN